MLPALAALAEDAGEELGGGFDVWVRFVGFAPCLGKTAFDGGLQDTRSVATKIRSRSLQRRHSRVKVREQFFDLRDDSLLFGERRERNVNILDVA